MTLRNPLREMDAERLVLWRSQTAEERLKYALQQMYVSRLLLIDGVRQQHPELSELEAQKRAVQEILAE